ncbi:hypothetical protein E2320_022425 [Naja naja]|nr:hypothetical protein E2320_022425 [Naja naja]
MICSFSQFRTNQFRIKPGAHHRLHFGWWSCPGVCDSWDHEIV